MSFDFILIFFVLRYLMRVLNTRDLYPQPDRLLRVAMVIAIGLFMTGLFFSPTRFIITWLGKFALIALVYILYSVKILKPARFIFNAILPYIAVSIFEQIIKDGFPALYSKWENILDYLVVFSILWGVGVWIITARQRKELSKVKERISQEEEKNRMMSAMKNELEKQVAERTIEITKQKEELESTLRDLKATQSQLVHSEKMASLGELTAGIAHEIQNPLNFVNNFSEVSIELLDEMNDALEKGNGDDAKEIARDVIDNLEKINHHGKRAGDIVKSMLQHSRSSSGQKELTDINSLCDEYLRLAYHGLRAKDKSFNAEMKTDFDENIPKINVVSQDIGRVILNLITNAFYACTERLKNSRGEEGKIPDDRTNQADYKPLVSISTQFVPNGNPGIDNGKGIICIKVADNGSGISPETIDKIFQPFFTTKPTGEGTGLGLSLSFDIIKAHGGAINVESKKGQGTEFTIQLPV